MTVTLWVVICMRTHYPDVLSLVELVKAFSSEEKAQEYVNRENEVQEKSNHQTYIYKAMPTFFVIE